MDTIKHTYLTPAQKLKALATRYYDGLNWTPMAGDFYTTSRADCELYRIARIENGVVYTEYCTNPGHYSQWKEGDFHTKDFGVRRVWVPHWVLNPGMEPEEIRAYMTSRVAKQ